jgi:hypothetical protein
MLFVYITLIIVSDTHFLRNFTSPHTVRIESGLSHAMEQYDRNRKVQMVMGDNRAMSKRNLR